MWDMILWVVICVSICNALIVILAKHFIKGWVEGDIAEYFALKAQKRDRDYQTRLRAELVAELLAEWTSPNEDLKKLRELTFKAFLWLPKDVAEKLSELLSHKQGDIRTVLSQVREILLEEDKDNKLDPLMIITFEQTPKETEIKKRTGKNGSAL
ncbi:hypothetical protein [Pseudescherichia vulneris]|uniref:hypothetical protein n=1 Tax=Pseudescherichia vulneris TaxID=566 RepID=UPI0030C92962